MELLMVRCVRSISMKPSLYARLYQAVFNGFYESILKGRKISEYLRSLEKTQYLPREKLFDLQRSRLRDLLRHAAANVPFYQERFRKIGLDPDKAHLPENFQKIPFLTKEDIRKNPEALRARNRTGRALRMTTGGSTGIPLRVDIDAQDFLWRRAAIMRGYGWGGYRDAEASVWIWGRLGNESFREKTKNNLHERLKRRRVYNAFSFGREAMSRCAREINAVKPRIVVAYASTLYRFARFIKETGRKVCPLEAALLGAEKVYAFQRRLIEEVFACGVFQDYGCGEVGPMAAECEAHGGMHIHDENIYFEVVQEDKPSKQEEVGEVVVTELTNYRTPIIRYKNQDLAAFSGRSCPCGRNLTLLKSVEGRILDAVQTADGRVVTGEFFPHLIKDFRGIEQFQVVQETLDHLVVRVVKEPGFPAAKLDELKNEISRAMGPVMNVEFQCVERIPLSPMGKFRVVVSKVPPVFEEPLEEMS
jgi:phenylacetate-CoA ligase